MINSNSMQYLPIYNQNNDINIFSYSKNSIHSVNNYETSNSIYPKNVIHRKNSAALLTAHNYQFKNMLPTITPADPINNDKTIYNNFQYISNNRNISSKNLYNTPQISHGLKKYNSSENLNVLNLPSIGVVSEQKNNISIYNSKPSNIMHCNTTSKNMNITSNSRVNKTKMTKIPHPKFQRKKLLQNNNFNTIFHNNTKTNYNILYNQNQGQNIFSNDNINTIVINNNNAQSSNNSILNDSFSYTHNYLNSLNSSFSSIVPIDNINQNQVYTEEEPGNNFNLSEFIILNVIGNGSEGSINVVNWQKNNKNYALKKCELIFDETVEKKKKEFLFLKEFIDNNGCDGIIKTYGTLCVKNEFGTYYFYELMELAERDWDQEILNRKKNNLYYQEYELMEIFRHLIKTLATLQSIRYTHRDIKPQNIMLVNGKLKLCDFGNGKLLKREGIIIQKIRGSELFMSPIVFKGYHSGAPTIRHNTFKSDVFSLGMCFFYAASLTVGGLNLIREMYDMKVIKKVLNQFLGKRYSQNLINLLYTMLQVDENRRPDFTELEILMMTY